MTLEIRGQHSLNNKKSEPFEIGRRQRFNVIILGIGKQQRERLSGMVVLED
jgi:hypothetical protein